MRFGISGCILACLLCRTASAADADPQTPQKPVASYVPIDISLVSPVNIFHFDRKVIVGLSLNIIHGWTASMYGIEIGGVVNREGEDMGGIQVAGFVNGVDGDATGIQFSGFYNNASGHCIALQLTAGVDLCGTGFAVQLAGFGAGGDDLSGLQVGGFATWSKNYGGLQFSSMVNHIHTGVVFQVSGLLNNAEEKSGGLQVTGGINLNGQSIPVVSGPMTPGSINTSTWTEYPSATFAGVMIAGGANFSKQLSGMQIAGFYNSARHATDPNTHEDVGHITSSVGVQISGLANSADDFAGIQLASAFNIANDLDGAQISALFNLARDVHGFQLGAVNVARKLTGFQLGAFNIAYGNGLPFMVVVNAGF